LEIYIMARIASKAVVRVDGKATAVVIAFTDGRTVEVELADLTTTIQDELMCHGLSQKLGDSYSSAAGNIDFAFAECSSVAEALVKGDWNRRGEVGGGMLVEALAALLKKTVGEVQTVLTDLDDDQKKALQKRTDVKAAIAKIKAERLALAAGDTDALDISALLKPQAS
jgi:hypothetical protein